MKKAKGKSKKVKVRGSQSFIKSGFILSFAFYLFTFAFFIHSCFSLTVAKCMAFG